MRGPQRRLGRIHRRGVRIEPAGASTGQGRAHAGDARGLPRAAAWGTIHLDSTEHQIRWGGLLGLLRPLHSAEPFEPRRVAAELRLYARTAYPAVRSVYDGELHPEKP